jgi:hypothetical protein
MLSLESLHGEQTLENFTEPSVGWIWVVVVRSPGFEPGSSGWEPDVLTKLD